MPDITAAQAVHYELEIEIQGSRSRVWKALTEEVNGWWLPDFHILGADSVVRLEPVAGGSLIEERADGTSLLWYTVQMATPEETLHLVGHTQPEWGGPSTSLLKLALEDRGDSCVLKVSDAIFGRIVEKTIQGTMEGWGRLFSDGLKAYVER